MRMEGVCGGACPVDDRIKHHDLVKARVASVDLTNYTHLQAKPHQHILRADQHRQRLLGDVEAAEVQARDDQLRAAWAR